MGYQGSITNIGIRTPHQRTRASRSKTWFYLTLVAAVVWLLLLASTASAANYAWTGASETSHNWSDAENWGGTAPSGTVGTLEFPELTTAACTANPATAACYETANDISGLSVNGISLDGPYKVNFSSFVSSAPGDALTLGSDGLTTSDPGNLKAVYATAVNVPITLSAPQTWSINGSLYLGGGVSGNEALGVNLSGGGNVDLNGAVNTGPVRVTGANAADTGESADDNGAVWVGAADPAANIAADLNGIDENPVTVNDAAIGSNEGMVGPLTLKGGDITFGLLGAGATLTVNGNLALDAASALESDIIYVPNSVNTATRVIASGSVNLGGAHLKIAKFGFGECELPEGDVFTLVTTTGSLEGTFGGLPNGSVVTMEKCPAPRSALRINYTSHSVTATVIGPAFTWSGEAIYTAPFWSNGTNWVGGVAPASSSSVGTLTFPVLTSADCPNTVTDACYGADNDLTDLSANQLQIDETHGYALSGNALALGSGGLILTTEEERSIQPVAHINLPLELASSQTWSLSGAPLTFGDLEVTGALSGSSSALNVSLADAKLALGAPGSRELPPTEPDDEVGDVTVTGPAEGNVTLKGPEEVDLGGSLELNADLNSTDGHSVTVENVALTDAHATGPLNATDSRLRLSGSEIGPLSLNNSLLQLEGPLQLPSVSFNAGSLFESPLDNRGTTAGTDYEPLTVTGPIDLGGATLEIPASIQPTLQTGECPAPAKGATYTLISTTGALEGSFGNALNGSTLMENECLTVGPHGEVLKDESYPFRISYNTTGEPQTVTATALGKVPVNTIPPGISGTTTEGQELTDVPGTWEGSPTSYSYQWERCNAAGEGCQAISGATGKTYTLTSADVGSTIRVQETGINGEGSGTPAVSDPTRVVQASSGGSSGGSTTSSGSSTSSTPNTGSSGSTGSGNSPTATISSVQLLGSLGSQLVPIGKGATIPSLLKTGSFLMPFTALEAGTASVNWYAVPAGAKLAKKSKAKPVLAASGHLTFAAAGKGTIKIQLTSAGKKLLQHAKSLKLTAKGTFTPTGKAATVTTKTFSLKGGR